MSSRRRRHRRAFEPIIFHWPDGWLAEARVSSVIFFCLREAEPVQEQLVTLEEAQGSAGNIEQEKASSAFFASSASRSSKRSCL
jgi:hypothetical protein